MTDNVRSALLGLTALSAATLCVALSLTGEVDRPGGQNRDPGSAPMQLSLWQETRRSARPRRRGRVSKARRPPRTASQEGRGPCRPGRR